MNGEHLPSKEQFLAALWWISAQILLQTPMSKERWRGYASRAEPRQWPHELLVMKLSKIKTYSPEKTSTSDGFWKDGPRESFKLRVVVKELWSLCTSTRWQSTPCCESIPEDWDARIPNKRRESRERSLILLCLFFHLLIAIVIGFPWKFFF